MFSEHLLCALFVDLLCLFVQVDTDGNGKLDKSEFQALVTLLKTLKTGPRSTKRAVQDAHVDPKVFSEL